MHRRYSYPIVVLLSLLLLFSCQSDKRRSIRSSEREEAEIALRELIYEITGDSSNILIPIVSLRSSLLESYTQYSQYDPLYTQFENEYLTSLSTILVEISYSSLPYFRDLLLTLSESPDLYVYSDTSMAAYLRENESEDVSSYLNRIIQANQARIRDAFESSKKEFDLIRLSYMNLEKSGKVLNLSEASPIESSTLTAILQNAILSYLESEEYEVKTRDTNRDTLSYDILWRLNNG